jgi:contactin 2
MYQCGAMNLQNSIMRYSSAELRVIEFPPTFLKKPMQGTVRAAIGGNATVVCNPEGAPKPTIQWYQNQMAIGNGGGHFRVLQNGNLVILGVTKMDEGNYTCDASNRLGRASGSTFVFIVDGTSIEQPFDRNIVANVNQTFFLPCTAFKPPNIDLAYYWTFNNEPLKMESAYYGAQMYAQDNFLRPGDLRIIRAQYTMEGEYRCIAKTTVDEVSISYHVSVRGPPGPAAGVKCGKMGETYGQVSFVAGADHGDPIQMYTIEAQTDRQPEWKPVLANISMPYNPTGEYVVEVRGLAAWSAYTFRVKAANYFGYGEPSQSSDSCNTNQDRPGSAPQNVSGGGGKIGDLRITWSPLPAEHWNGQDIKYLVYFRKLGTQTAWEVVSLFFLFNFFKFLKYET